MRFKTFVLLAFLPGVLGAQTFVNFPAGYDGLPEQALKGPIHTVLTIEQSGNQIFSTVVEVYDEKGRRTESLNSNAGVEIHSGTMVRLGGKTTYIYNASGQLIRTNSLSPEGEMSGYTLNKYDEKGRLVETSLFDSKGKSTGWERYAYDADKREVAASWLFTSVPAGPNEEPMRSVLTYDEQGRWTSRLWLFAGKETITFEYDKDGNLSKESHEGWSHTYAFKFDKYGNWIDRIRGSYQLKNPQYHSAEDGRHVYRMITYYTDAAIK